MRVSSHRGFRSLATLAAVPLLIFTGAGCNDDTVEVTMPEYKVEASFSGRVLSVPDGATLPGASFELSGTTTSGVSDDQGVIHVTGMQEGSYRLLVSAPGHASTRLDLDVAGGGPTSGPIHLHRDVYLAQNTGSLKLRLIGPMSGMPAAGARAELGFWWLPGGDPSTDNPMAVDDPDVPGSVAADSSGVIELSGLPATEFVLKIAPYDENGDGVDDDQAVDLRLSLDPGSRTTRMVMLPRADTTVEVVSTNLPLGGEFSDSTIFLVYSTPMDTSAHSTRATLAEGPDEVPLHLSWSSPVRLVLRPVTPAAPGDYDLEVYARSATGMADQWSTSFHWSTGSAPPGTCDEEVADLGLSRSEAPIDFNTGEVTLEWSALPCAGGYAVYAKDDRNNPSWILVREEPTDYDTGKITTSFSLPESFDRYQVDGMQTPFAGIRVTFSVVPRKAGRPEPGGAHASLPVTDVTAPEIASVIQIGSGRNDGVESVPLGFRVGLSEYLAASVGAPLIEIKEAGGDPGFALDPADGRWQWDAGAMGGTFGFTLEGGSDASGDSVRFLFDRLEDLSGNLVPGPVRSDWAAIGTWGGEFDFERSGQGWTRTGEGWAWGRPYTGPQGAHSGTGCWATNQTGTYGSRWNTDLTSPPLHVPLDQPVLSFWHWHRLHSWDDTCEVQILSEGETYGLGTYTGNSSGWRYVTAPLSEYAGRTIRLRFHFISADLQSPEDAGYFLDDVQITGAEGGGRTARLLPP